MLLRQLFCEKWSDFSIILISMADNRKILCNFAVANLILNFCHVWKKQKKVLLLRR